eukprot:CAMPEP_0184868214 /NCGR_PEP_ID=MMETSP0580-20130426/29586_1 /TAXON_ID=1118495 /ORGANISM="Dactyliosolen fragilissimus" /LENGTH=665 /DNA_ID=CAMNT_0027368967 /DNA_START=159 /DNA_END=2153 /DNA_ORIENTATION=-
MDAKEQNDEGEQKLKYLNVDISSSLVGDHGMKSFIDKIFPRTDGGVDKSSKTGEQKINLQTFTLSARMNLLTPFSISYLFNRMVEIGKHNNMKYLQSTKSIENLVDIDGNLTTTEETVANSTNNKEAAQESEELASDIPFLFVHSLDIGLNDIGMHGSEISKVMDDADVTAQQRLFFKSLQVLIGSQTSCPNTLRMDSCGLGPPACRSIGKGIIDGAKVILDEKTELEDSIEEVRCHKKLKELYLNGNDAIGDAGAAAIAAALRTSNRLPKMKTNSNQTTCQPDSLLPVLEHLDLSSCGIGDTGAEALALAIEGSPGCIKSLNLRNNKITDEGAMALGRAIKISCKKNRSCGLVELDLSNNPKISCQGVTDLAHAFGNGSIKHLSIRSCSIGADGSSALGRALVHLASTNVLDSLSKIDISGNMLGTQSKPKKSTAYSASLLRSKASASFNSHMSFIGNKLKKGLKDVGFDMSGAISESDDDQESNNYNIDERATSRCGIRAFSDSIIDELEESLKDNNVDKNKGNYGDDAEQNCKKILIGLRMCSLDDGASDSLAAAVLAMKENLHTDLLVDITMNSAIENYESIIALQHGSQGSWTELLDEMSTKYTEIREALRIARKRAVEELNNAAARDEAEAIMSGAFYNNDEDYSDYYDLPQYDDGDNY